MAIATSLQTQITALSNRLNTLATTATPEELAYLSKAIEGIAGQVSAIDLKQYSEQLAADLDTTKTAGVTAVNAAKTTALADVETARVAAVNTLTAAGITRPELHAAMISF